MYLKHNHQLFTQLKKLPVHGLERLISKITKSFYGCIFILFIKINENTLK